MGIPYYFASLLRNHKGIVQTCTSKLECDVLAIDFNCLIHKYLEDGNPIESVIRAIQMILDSVCSATKVYIGADGLAPYAKLVNQRQRRFKRQDVSTFDRNQISPGTPYMTELITTVRARFPSAHVSGTEEPGEGEHKLFAWLKTLSSVSRRSICIYGLDADLILLSLNQKNLSTPHSMWLLRESTEFKTDKETFSTMSIWKLAEVIPIPFDQYLRLSILCFGNDFMPNMSMFALRENGYMRALSIYKQAGSPDLQTMQGLVCFIREAAKQETYVLSTCIHKREVPFESSILTRDETMLEQRHAIHLLDGYSNHARLAELYWKTYSWTLQYFFTNNPTNWNLSYPFAEAPLLQTLARFPISLGIETVPLQYSITQQLQMILPKSSLERAGGKPIFEDEMYDEGKDSRIGWMKKYGWECKPLISIPWNPISELTTVRQIVLS